MPQAIPLKQFKGRPVVLSLVAIIGVIALAAAIYLWAHRVLAVPGMIYYPGGAFPFGPDNKPVNLGPFYIDETEVSNADYAEFCRAMGCTPPAGAPDLPVVGVTIVQARAYAKWKGRRLPIAQEWERAARGVDAMRYPWGKEDDPKRANVLDNPTLVNHALMPVRSFAKLPEYQMAGNVWELIDTPAMPPSPKRDERWIQIRGGSYNTPLSAAVTYEYRPIPESFSGPDIGFRCAKTFP
jgi:gamma-glutamyl hercynylcysteine S-oxide synthase